jgi:predicted P-loop ATPase
VFDKDADWPGVAKAIRGMVAGDIAKDNILAAVRAAATVHAYDPLKDWVESLKWDGVKRLDDWLIKTTRCEDRGLYRAIGRAWMIGLAYRATTEYDGKGTKMDSVLVLQGKEGIGKSTIGEVIGGEWYASFTSSLNDDDIFYVIERTLVLEFDELDSMTRSEASRVKSLVTSQADTFRRKYGEVANKKPRRCVFIGTTNDEQFLTRDMTMRRWWIIRCGETLFNLDWLRASRDQLIAEAVNAMGAGELPLLPKHLHQEHRITVEATHMEHPYEEAVDLFTKSVDQDGRFTLSELCESILKRTLVSLTMTENRKLGDVLRAKGWEKVTTKCGKRWELRK